MYSMFMLDNQCWMKHHWVVAWTSLQSLKTHWIHLWRQFNRETETNPMVELNIQIFLKTHPRTSCCLAIPFLFSLHRLSCSVLVDSLEKGFHVLYLHLDSHHVDPSKYNQQLLQLQEFFVASWFMFPVSNSFFPGFTHWKKTCLLYPLVGGFNPFEKYWSKWESSLNRGENKKYLKPPPSCIFCDLRYWAHRLPEIVVS